MKARVLYVPNESGEWRQRGLRRALQDLEDAGLIEAHRVFSLLWRVRNGGDSSAHRRGLVTAVREFRPTVVLVQHMDGSGITRRDVADMRFGNEFNLIYHEGDAHHPIQKPLPPEARVLGATSDITYVSGRGLLMRNFIRAGAKDVRYAQWCFDTDRFPREAINDSDREFDVVIVANHHRPGLRAMPGLRARKRFVDAAQERWGDRLALYGAGWAGSSARGPLAFDDQVRAVRSAWVSANWDHFPRVWGYHSDRLPISLAAGTVHATTLHPGFEEVFPRAVAAAMILAERPKGLLASIDRLLETTTPQERLTRMRIGQDHAYSSMAQNDQLVGWLNDSGAQIDAMAAKSAWARGGPLRDDL